MKFFSMIRGRFGGRRLAALWLIGASAAMVGCQCSPGPARFTYQIEMDDSMRLPNGQLPSIEVDLVGANEAQKPQFEAITVGDYFAPNNPRRATAQRQTVTLTNNAPGPRVLEDDEPFWDDWVGRNNRGGNRASTLFVFANMAPPPGASAAGDPRKLKLPLDRCQWENPREPITIRVTPAGLVATPGPSIPGG